MNILAPAVAAPATPATSRPKPPPPDSGVVPAYKLAATKAVLAERERELLELKGPCSTCRLHYAHAGPCDTRS